MVNELRDYIIDQSMRCVLDFITEDMGYRICKADTNDMGQDCWTPTDLTNDDIIDVLNEM